MRNFPPGHMLGPYKIVSQLGQGGMAIVYKAYHASMDRYVALKVLSHQFAFSQEFYGRFQNEARLIARLEHAHILPVYDFGESDGIPFLVMRYLDAGTLKDRLATGPLALRDVNRIFTQLIEALGYAHEHGIIHRDIKPSNAMLDKRGEVFLTDFGIAKLVEGSPQFTATGAITGTPAYMSPEQAQGLKIDPRSDLYSMGIVLYEMLTGKVPFEAETPLAVILKQIQEPLPPLSSVKPDIHSAIEAVVLKALAKDPADRFNNTEDFLTAWKLAYQEAEAGASAQPHPSVPAPQPRQPSIIKAEPSRVSPAIPPSPPSRVSQAVPSETSAQSHVSQASSPSQAAPQTNTPAEPAKGVSRKMLIGGLGGCATLLVILCTCAVIFRTLRPVEPTPPPDIISMAPPASTNETSPNGITASSETSGSWESWTAANFALSIAIKGEEIFAGGGGGLTVWNKRDGSYQHFTMQDGIPGPSVNTILIDEDNSIWLGTDEGIGQLDQGKWRYFSYDQGLDSSYITSISRVGDTLWAGTIYGGSNGSGLHSFTGTTWNLLPGFPSTYEDDPSQSEPGTLSYNVNRVLGDSLDNLWVATTAGIGRYDGTSWTVYDESSGLPDEVVNTIFFDSKDRLWVGTNNGYLANFNGQAFDTVRNLNEIGIYEIYGLAEDKDGLIWLAGEGGVASYDPQVDGWEIYSPEYGNYPTSAATALAVDVNGDLYFGTWSDGLIRYDGKDFKTQKVPNVPRYLGYYRIVPASDGKLWFVEEYANQEVDIIDPSNEIWSEGPAQDNCCWQPLIWSGNGDLWSGGYNGLWVISSNQQVLNYTTDHGLPSNTVTAAAFTPDGQAWIGTDSGLASFDGSSVTAILTTGTDDLPGDWIYVLKTTSDGSLWVGSDGGLSQRTPNGEWIHYRIGDTFTDRAEWISDLADDSQGSLWVTTWGDGIYRLQDGAWKHYDPESGTLPDQGLFISSLALGVDGSLWFGTYWDGLLRLVDSQWIAYSTGSGLAHPNVNDIFVDQAGSVWFATSGGISRYMP